MAPALTPKYRTELEERLKNLPPLGLFRFKDDSYLVQSQRNEKHPPRPRILRFLISLMGHAPHPP
jgi:hypothetical protein